MVATDALPAKAERGVSHKLSQENSVFVVGRNEEPLMPCHPARARRLLANGRTRIHRLHPFTIRLTDRTTGAVQPTFVKMDPGSKVTGIAIVRQGVGVQHVLHLSELTHRGASVRKHVSQRAMFRRRRRSANFRYRAPRFNNRTRRNGWLPPSLMRLIDNIQSWITRFLLIVPVTGFVQKLVRFDMQAMTNPDIQGVEYQRGTLAGHELREYLLEKWRRKCAYCDAENVPLQVERIHPKARGGSDRVTNLTLACRCCNEAKGSQPVETFLAKKPGLLKCILAQAKQPLSDTAAANSTRWELWRRLSATGLPVQTGSGGRTKWNRSRFDVPKSHCLDAVCAGTVETVAGWNRQPLTIKATGRGSYQRARLDAYGFPRGFLMWRKLVHGFQTGDLVRAIVPTGKKAGPYTGRAPCGR
ncbi:MAG: RNA-guided endonuclease IscB [Rhodospirillaceae bacterium]